MDYPFYMSNNKKTSIMNKTVVWWQVAIFTFLLNIVTGLVILSFTRGANGYDKTKEEITKKADKTYVDQQDNVIRQEVKEIKTDLKESVEVIRGDVKEIRNYIMTHK